MLSDIAVLISLLCAEIGMLRPYVTSHSLIGTVDAVMRIRKRDCLMIRRSLNPTLL
jgi:hypothetical protein